MKQCPQICRRLVFLSLLLTQFADPSTAEQSQLDQYFARTDSLVALVDFDAAESLSREALSLSLKLHGPIHQRVASSMNVLGAVLMRKGEFSEAESLLTTALSMQRSVAGDSSAATGKVLNNLSELWINLGDYASAEALAREAVALHHRAYGAQHALYAASLYNLAVALIYQGSFVEAERFSRQALSISLQVYGTEHPVVAECLGAIGAVQIYLGQLDEATETMQAALNMRRRLLGDLHIDLGVDLHNLAGLYYQQQDFAAAEPLYRESLTIHQHALGMEHPRLGAVMHNLAWALMRQGKMQAAQDYLEKTLQLREKCLGQEHPMISRTLADLGSCHLVQGHLVEAEATLERAGRLFELARRRAGVGYTRATFVSTPYSILAGTRLLLGKEEQAWPAAERAISRVLVDLVIASGRNTLTNAEQAREDSLKSGMNQLESELTLLQGAVQTDTTAAIMHRIESVRSRLLAAEAAWSHHQQSISASVPITEGQAYSLARVQSSLPESTALVGWLTAAVSFTEFRTWGYVIRNRGPVRWVYLGSPEISNELPPCTVETRAFREAIDLAANWPTRIESADGLSGEIQRLSNLWFLPLSPHLEGATHLVIIPSSFMLGVPVEVWRDATGEFLGDRYVISYAPSATMYTWLMEQSVDSDRQAGVLLIGDPAFDADHPGPGRPSRDAVERDMASVEGNLRDVLNGSSEALAQLPRLPWTQFEIAEIARCVDGEVVLLGMDASEGALRDLVASGSLRRFRVIHMATHALIDHQQPERSALVLAQIIPHEESKLDHGDGLLTAKEIGRSWDLDADLVALSGCQTALGKRNLGEGFIGFAHVFFQVGARCLLLSLWKVDDQATALLMGEFYRNLQTGDPLGDPGRMAVALQKAKRWLRDYRDEDGAQPFRHPAYWSGFILIGRA